MNICRTCGFTDCPGANGGDCPRWPARDTSDLDALTLDELYALHDRLCAEHAARHKILMDPHLSTLSAGYAVLAAKQAETDEAAEAAYAEIARRQPENADIFGRTDA